MNYWLSRDDSADAEGPFARSQIQSMFQNGSLTALARVSEVDGDEWISVEVLLGHETLYNYRRNEAKRVAALKKKKRESLVLKWVFRGVGLAAVYVVGMIWWADFFHPDAVAARSKERSRVARERAEREVYQAQIAQEKQVDQRKRWNDVAGIFREVGCDVRYSSDPEIMHVVVPFDVARQMSAYEFKSLAKLTQSRLGTYAQIYLRDQNGVDLGKATFFGASSDK